MFEHSLIELEKRPRTGKRWLSFPVAVAVHLFAFGAVAFVSTWSVGEVAEADFMDPFVIPLQLPEPQKSPQPEVRRPEAPQQQAPAAPQPAAPPPAQIIQPGPVIPDAIPNADDLPTAPDPNANPVAPSPQPCPGCNGTDPNADPNAKPSGEGTGDGPVVLKAGMRPPVVVSRVEPRYTESARKVGLQGVVIVEAIIDQRGRVESVRVLRGLPLGLEESAVAAVRQWKFEPATTLDGRPVKVYYNLTINFRVLR